MKRRISVFLLSVTLLAASAALHGSAASSFKLKRIETGYLNQVVPAQMQIQLIPVMQNATSEVSLFWKVNDSSVATVTQDGVLTPKKAGQVKVTATALGMEQSATTTVTFAPAELIIETSADKVLYGNTAEFNAEIKFKEEKYSDKAYLQSVQSDLISWSVDNTQAASITQQGVLNTQKTGRVKVTASVKNASDFTASYTVDVVNGFIELSFPNSEDIVDVGFTMQPRIQAYANYVGSNDKIVWKSMDGKSQITDLTTEYTEEHVSLAKITFNDSGEAVIRASLADDPTVYADYTFNVLTYSAELLQTIDEAIQNYDMDAYTALRWNSLQYAIKEAQAVYDNESATQKEIIAAIEKLRSIMRQMDTPDYDIKPDDAQSTVSETVITDNTETESDSGDAEDENGKVVKRKKVLRKNNDSAPSLLWTWISIAGGVAVAGGAAAVIIIVRRRKLRKAYTESEKQ